MEKKSFNSTNAKENTSTTSNPNSKSPVKLLSRLKEGAPLKDPVYIASYWEEHKNNFISFYNDLLQVETIKKLIANASQISLEFNSRSHLVPAEYNETVIRKAYLTMEQDFKDQKSKKTFLDGFTLFMDFLIEIKKTIAKDSGSFSDISEFFKDSGVIKKIKPFASSLLGKNYNKEKNAELFFPQLMFFFVRFFDIYDSSLKGAPIDIYMKDLERKQRDDHIDKVKRDPSSLKETWSSSSKSVPIGPSEPLKYQGLDDPEPSNPALEEEIVNLQEMEENSRLDIQALWNYKGKEFEEKWRSLSDEERKHYLRLVRDIILTIPTAKSAIVYCPELNAEDLSANNGEAFLKLVNECHQYTNDVSKLDEFTSQISMKLKAKGPSKRSLAIIVYSRRYTRELFCTNMVVEVLDLGKEGNTGETIETQTIYDLAEKSLLSKLPEKLEKPERFDDESSSSDEEEETKKVVEIKDKDSTSNSTSTSNPNLKKCSNPNCSKIETPTYKFEVCGYCKKKQIIVPYCSRACQQADWSKHKLTCVGKTN